MSDALGLAFASGRPYAGLRDHRPSPELDAVVAPELARRLRVVALGADATTVRVAAADPSADLSALEERLGERRLDVAVAERAEVDAILGPPPAATEPPAGPPPQTRRSRLAHRRPLLLAIALSAAAAVLAIILATRGDARPSPRPPAAVAAPAPPRPRVVVVAAPDSTTRLVVGATVILAPGGGCITAPRARDLAAHPGLLDLRRHAARVEAGRAPARRAAAQHAFDARHRLRPVAVRDAAGTCVLPDPTAVATGRYPLAATIPLAARGDVDLAITGLVKRRTVAVARPR